MATVGWALAAPSLSQIEDNGTSGAQKLPLEVVGQHCLFGLSINFNREQLRRAASSVCLNLGEGSGRATAADHRRFYTIALGSLRECEAILTLSEEDTAAILSTVDKLGAFIFKLIMSPEYTPSAASLALRSR